MTPEQEQLIEVGTLLAQELTEIIEDAREASGDDNALASTQSLLDDWERAYKACDFFGK